MFLALMALLAKMVDALGKRATRCNDACIVGASKSRSPLPFALLRRACCCCGVNSRAAQRIAAAAVMGPRSAAIIKWSSGLRWCFCGALKALKAGALGGRATRHDDEDEVQPLRLRPPLPLHSPPGGERRADLSLTILKSTIFG